tara:strand:- start:289 stop:930 length:642 start_codon:yes stop_codon:yes gene_type:complete
VKAALIVLTLLLLGSLGTSAYLLMEQKKAEKLINDAHAAADAQKKMGLKLTAQKIAEEKEKLSLKGQLAVATNNLVVAQQTLASVQGGQGQMATDLNSAQAARATLQSQLTVAQGLADKAKELQTAIADHEATNAKLSKALTDANRTHAEKSIELGKAINALKPFLSTGLTPEQIKELQQKRPVEIAAPRFIAPKPIKPGKLSKPIQQSIQTP